MVQKHTHIHTYMWQMLRAGIWIKNKWKFFELFLQFF